MKLRKMKLITSCFLVLFFICTSCHLNKKKSTGVFLLNSNKIENFEIEDGTVLLLLEYFPNKNKCKWNDNTSVEASFGIIINPISLDTIRVLTLCDFNKEIPKTKNIICRYRQSKFRRDEIKNIYIPNEGISYNRKMKTIYGQLIYMIDS